MSERSPEQVIIVQFSVIKLHLSYITRCPLIPVFTATHSPLPKLFP